MRRILLDNAYESWTSAIEFHNSIVKGYATLKYQKGFVSSLHNSVELFLKQIMINDNDHDVASIKKVDNVEKANLLVEYYNSNNLNDFFERLSVHDVDKLNWFYSIEYSQIVKKINKIIVEMNCRQVLERLGYLRNNETHFCISKNSFLSEEDFCGFHNFMVCFFKLLCDRCLMPDYITKNNSIFFDSEYYGLFFVENEWDDFSYVNAVKDNPLSNRIKTVLQSSEFGNYSYSCATLFDFAQYITVQDKSLYDEFEHIATLLVMMNNLGLIEVPDKLNENARNYQKIGAENHIFCGIKVNF